MTYRVYKIGPDGRRHPLPDLDGVPEGAGPQGYAEAAYGILLPGWAWEFTAMVRPNLAADFPDSFVAHATGERVAFQPEEA
jgi:hypothetical protein